MGTSRQREDGTGLDQELFRAEYLSRTTSLEDDVKYKRNNNASSITYQNKIKQAKIIKCT
jgi:hypothetical protein